MNPADLWKRWVALFEDKDDPSEPHYDPVHLAVVLIGCLVVIGALFWLLWTLFVYEGGLFRKVVAFVTRLADPAAEQHMLRDAGPFGGPGHATVYEGWLANVSALLIAIGVIAGLHRADRRAARRAK